MADTDFNPDEFAAFKAASVTTPAPPDAAPISSDTGFDPNEFAGFKTAPTVPGAAKAAAPAEAAPTFLGEMGQTVTDIPHKIYEAGANALSTINRNLNPFSEEGRKAQDDYIRSVQQSRSVFDVAPQVSRLGDVNKGIMAIPALASAPVTGLGRSVIGHTFDAISPSFTPEQKAQLEAHGLHAITGDEAADIAMSAIAPARGPFAPPPVAPTPPVGNGPLGVTLSAGQESGALPLIQMEQKALRSESPLGAAAHARAQQFANQQAAEVAAAHENVARNLDPFQQTIAGSPQEAGQLVSQGLQGAAQQAKAGVRAAYKTAQSLPGEIDAAAFRDMPNAIKTDLSQSAQPVFIDQNTPSALNMINYLDSKIGQLRIPNAADPLAPPPANQIVGVNLTGVDQWRKALSQFRRDAFKSGNGADQRAAQSVLDAFDDRIDQAVNGGQFRGDPRAIRAWNDARAANADYRQTFTKQGPGDPVGAVVERILGRGNTPAAIPNDVADFIYGGNGVNPNTLNVAVAQRIRDTLGPQSPEWSGVKQGLFSRLVETPPGVTDWGPQKVSQNLNNFLNGSGKEMAATLYSPQERALLQEYADLNKKLVVPQSGANWSNTGPLLARVADRLSGIVGMALGSMAGHGMGLPFGVSEGAGYLAAKGAGKLAEMSNAKQIAKQMPLVADAMAKYQKALNSYNRSMNPLSRNAAVFAGGNLARALSPLGVSLSEFGELPLQMPGTSRGDQQEQKEPPAHASGGAVDEFLSPFAAHGGAVPDEESKTDQDGVPRPPSDEHNDDDKGKTQAFAHGGRVIPSNIDREPSEAQKKAGNYAKDHVRVHGLEIAIENAKGHERKGIGRDGKPWSVRMPSHYGYLKKSIGADRDHVDIYLGPHRASQKVYIVDQLDADTGLFDEHKVGIGFGSPQQFQKTYERAFSDGKGRHRVGALHVLTVPQFKAWLEHGNTKQPFKAVI